MSVEQQARFSESNTCRQHNRAQLAARDAERKQLLAEQRQLTSKLITVQLVEDGVRDLYVQMKVSVPWTACTDVKVVA